MMNNPSIFRDALVMVPNNDSRSMQALPWRTQIGREDRSVVADNGRVIMDFWGEDDRHTHNRDWCTAAQRKNHLKYTLHTINQFPVLQNLMEYLYSCAGMPQEALKAIEKTMEKAYIKEVPPYVR